MDVILGVDALTRPLGGIGRYTLELARGLERHPGVSSLRYYCAFRLYDDLDRARRANARVGSFRRRRFLPSLTLPAYIWLRDRAFRRAARKMGGALLHAPNFLLMPQIGPGVVTIHDLSCYHYPEFHPPERVRLLERQLPKTVDRADLILAPSRFVAAEIVERFGIEETRLCVTPLGVSAAFRPHAEPETRPVLSGLGLTHGAYLLSVTSHEPWKNLAGLLRAYAGLDPGTRRQFPLVLVGAAGWVDPGLEKLAAPLERRGELIRPGYLAEEQLPAVYAGAAGFAFPSLYEGFGLPLLEALASGVPTLAADRAALPELAGDAAMLVDPEDDQALRAGLTRLLGDDPFRLRAKSTGPARAREFTWTRCVDRTVEAYRAAAGRG